MWEARHSMTEPGVEAIVLVSKRHRRVIGSDGETVTMMVVS
jgi:hypothetical protein